MLTGKEAITHDIVNIGGGVPIKDGIRMIQEVLKDQGWQTGAVDTMGRHFSRGFDHYHSPEWDRSDPLTLRRAQHVTDLAVPMIEELKSGDKPFFLFLHYWDPHTPYLPPEPYRTMFYEEGRDPYDPNNHSMDPAWNDEMFKWYFHEWMPGVTDTEYVNALYDAETRYMETPILCRRFLNWLAFPPTQCSLKARAWCRWQTASATAITKNCSSARRRGKSSAP
jgi:arylsulfatase A-like enzyme